MKLSKIEIKNFRLLIDATLNLDNNTTVIVGRNNSAKTSFMDFIRKVLHGEKIEYNDYPLSLRKVMLENLIKYLNKELSFEEFCSKTSKPSIKFFIDYSLEGENDNLGGLSPFIIDINEAISQAIILARYDIDMNEKEMCRLFEGSFDLKSNDRSTLELDQVRKIVIGNFSRFFSLKILAVNPGDENDFQIKTIQNLKELFPCYLISAERDLDEKGYSSSSSLKTVISEYFSVDLEKLGKDVSEKVIELRSAVETANISIQAQTDLLLSELINNTIGFGYPNAEELQLGVATNLSIANHIKDSSELTYNNIFGDEKLPSSHNGLGYKNLLKIQFELARFANDLNKYNTVCVPILLIEEPESHMHPQMQQVFIGYLEKFLQKISKIKVQTVITTHSSHIANTISFSKIRYAYKMVNEVIYKDLQEFALENPDNLDFLNKYLTLTRCDLFFADKVILVEGASERLLIPDMIIKSSNSLSSQYYSIIEVGGAYAHIFIPLVKFLNIPCLIITDIDSVDSEGKKCKVSKGTHSSNATINNWVRNVKGLKQEDEISLSLINSLSIDEKTVGKIHLEFQIYENDICGRSLEEAIMNCNRDLYLKSESLSEDDIEFNGKSKTTFALDLLMKNNDYNIPQYIANGLNWLSNQKR